MIYQTFLCFELPAILSYILFSFFGTLCSYNFHWYFTPSLYGHSQKAAWSYKNKTLHAALFILGVLGAVYFGYQLHRHWEWLLATAFITFLYSAPKIPLKPFNWLKHIAIGKTIFLAYSWTHITAFLPIELSGTPWNMSYYLFVINRFFLIYPICILFDLRDKENDKKEGIRSMITDFDNIGVSIVFWGSVFVFFITALAFSWAGLPHTMVLILSLPGLVLSFIYRYSQRNLSDYYYYFILDGLMMLSGLLILFMQF